jgi:hypothetical protein
MTRLNKSHIMSHFVSGLPVQIGDLMFSSCTVRLVKRPHPVFKFALAKAEFRDLHSRNAEDAAFAFMAIKTVEDALAVFSFYGRFALEEKLVGFTEIQRWIRAAWRFRMASLEEIKSWSEELSSYGRGTQFDPYASELRNLLVFSPPVTISLADPPHLSFEYPDDIRHCLRIVLHLEKLQGIQHRFCALDDCRKPFRMKGGIEKKFCSYDCGHKAAVRASRKRAKKGIKA